MRKEFLFPISLLILGFLFFIINTIVFFSRGNAWFIKKKLKTGTLILALISILACNSPKTVNPPVTCYTPQPQENKNDSIVLIQKKHSDSIALADKEKRKKDSVNKLYKRTTICYVAPVKHK